MLDTRFGRILGFIIGIGLLLTAAWLFKIHQPQSDRETIGKVDVEATRELYQERLKQTRVILSQAGY
uniref:Uncharacterized protein n=1 Tax=candidate division WOR-3 bacterium TaxID=2052148 RepID=A0A7V3PTS4_UNCW3